MYYKAELHSNKENTNKTEESLSQMQYVKSGKKLVRHNNMSHLFPYTIKNPDMVFKTQTSKPKMEKPQ